jgi:hypothetical protein
VSLNQVVGKIASEAFLLEAPDRFGDRGALLHPAGSRGYIFRPRGFIAGLL